MKIIDFIADIFVTIERWVKDHMPFMCAGCGRTRFMKNRLCVMHRTGKWVSLCKDCYEEVFAPFSKEYKDE
jgi:hypothetical protein